MIVKLLFHFNDDAPWERVPWRLPLTLRCRRGQCLFVGNLVLPPTRQYRVRASWLVLLPLLCVASCSSEKSGMPAATTSERTALVTTSPTTEPSSVRLTSAVYMCGPTDGAWVEARVVSSEGVSVMAQVTLDGKPLGRSERVSLVPNQPAAIGFEPGTKAADHGRAATVQVFIAGDEDTGAPVDERDVVLSIPSNVQCG